MQMNVVTTITGVAYTNRLRTRMYMRYDSVSIGNTAFFGLYKRNMKITRKQSSHVKQSREMEYHGLLINGTRTTGMSQ